MKPYPKYKDSEVEWIGEVPEHWEILAIFRQFLSMAKGPAAVYGLCFFFILGVMVAMSGGNPVDLGWLRWPGGILIGLGIGALSVRRDPAKQGVFVTAISLGTLLAGLGLLYSWILHEYSAATWFIALPAIIILVVSALLWWSLQKAKGIL